MKALISVTVSAKDAALNSHTYSSKALQVSGSFWRQK